MPNATCFLIAYALVLVFEIVRLVVADEGWRGVWGRLSVGMFVLAWVTHSLYLVDLGMRSGGEGGGASGFCDVGGLGDLGGLGSRVGLWVDVMEAG